MLVLLVDDDLSFRTSLKAMLQRLGFDVIEAGDGIEAYEIIQENSAVDLIIADLLMPRMDGLALGEAIRKLHPDLPILFITGVGFSLRKKPSGCGFLRKPFHQEDLVRAIREITSGAQGNPRGAF